MAMHVFGVTNDDNLWHSILPDQTFFGDVDGSGGTARPWRTGDGTSPTARDSACAADSEGNLHVLVVSSDGRLWHTRREASDGTWTRFGNVEAGGAGQIGTVTAVAAATEGTALHILAANGNNELHRTVWNPPTSTDPARFDPPFHKVGTWNPAKGLLHTLAASGFPDEPADGTARVVLDDVPVLRETGGAAPDQGVERLQQMLNLAGFGATPTTGSGLLSETGVYDSATAAAVRRFQQAEGLPEDGVMNGDTWRAFLTFWLLGRSAEF